MSYNLYLPKHVTDKMTPKSLRELDKALKAFKGNDDVPYFKLAIINTKEYVESIIPLIEEEIEE